MRTIHVNEIIRTIKEMCIEDGGYGACPWQGEEQGKV